MRPLLLLFLLGLASSPIAFLKDKPAASLAYFQPTGGKEGRMDKSALSPASFQPFDLKEGGLDKPDMQLSHSLTIDSLGACQGISWLQGKAYLYGDREV